MYLDNPNIKLPEDPETIVWKYLDLSKFLDLGSQSTEIIY